MQEFMTKCSKSKRCLVCDRNFNSDLKCLTHIKVLIADRTCGFPYFCKRKFKQKKELINTIEKTIQFYINELKPVFVLTNATTVSSHLQQVWIYFGIKKLIFLFIYLNVMIVIDHLQENGI